MNFLLIFSADAQIKNAADWIPKNNQAIKLSIDQKGVYRVSFSELSKKGFIIHQDSVAFLKLYNLGKNYPLNVTINDKTLISDKNFIEFYAEKYKGQLDTLFYQEKAKKSYESHSFYTELNVFYLIKSISSASDFPLFQKYGQCRRGPFEEIYRQVHYPLPLQTA